MNRNKNKLNNIDDEYKPFVEVEDEDQEIIDEPTQEMPVVKPELKAEKVEEKPIKKGFAIIFNGNKSYSGLNLSQYTGGRYTVKEISGDRIVIAKGSEIIAAVNIKDCKRV